MLFLEIHCVRLPKKRPVLPSFAHSFVAWLELEFVGEPGTKQLAEHVQAIAIKIFEKNIIIWVFGPIDFPVMLEFPVLLVTQGGRHALHYQTKKSFLKVFFACGSQVFLRAIVIAISITILAVAAVIENTYT